MSSLAIPVYDSIVSLIDAGTYSMGAVTSQRVWAPKTTREAMQSLQVLVVGDLKQTTINARDRDRHDLRPAIFVQKAVNPNDNTEVDALVELVEEIENVVLRQSVAGAQWVNQTEAELSEPYLWEMRAFVAAFELNYAVFS